MDGWCGRGALAGPVVALLVVLLVGGCASATPAGPAPSSPTEVSTVSDDHIRVDLERGGGFTGLRRCAAVDTDALPVDEAEQVRAALRDVDLDALAARPTNPRVPALDLVVVRDARRTAVRLDETTVPEQLRPLIQLLDQRAQPC